MISSICIVGYGSIGKRHYKVIKKLYPSIKIILIKSNKNKKQNGMIYHTIQEAIEIGIDAAIIASPSSLHLQHSLEFLKKNIPVLIEKPLSNSLSNLSKLTDTKNKNNALVLMGYCLRHDQSAQRFFNLIKKNNYKDILHVEVKCKSFLPDWRPSFNYLNSVSGQKKLGGGVLNELSHEIDYINWFFRDLKSIYSSHRNSKFLQIDVEDSADIIFETHSGFNINLQLSFNCHRILRQTSIQYKNGMLIWDAISKTITWSDPNNPPVVQKFSQENFNMYEAQIKHFFNCIKNIENPKSTLENGIDILNIIDCARKSNKEKRMILL